MRLKIQPGSDSCERLLNLIGSMKKKETSKNSSFPPPHTVFSLYDSISYVIYEKNLIRSRKLKLGGKPLNNSA